MNASKLRPAVAYLRRSTDRQEQSIEDQRTAIRLYAEEHGYEIVRDYVDDAISGTSTAARKGFLQLLADAQGNGHEWRHVLVYDVKRFGRVDNDEAGHYRFLLRQAGVEVIYVAESFSGDDTDDLLRPVKQWQARQESRDLSKVTIRGQLSLSEGGWWLGGAPPYGYDLLYHDSGGKPYQIVRFLEDGRKAILGPDGELTRTLPKGERLSTSKKDRARLVPSTPDRVAVVQRIFQMYVAGMGLKTIAARLNVEGVASPRNRGWAKIHDGHWPASTIRAILTNPVYCGDMVWNRRTFAKFHRIANGRTAARPPVSAGKWGANPEDDWVVVRQAHPALIDRDTFERAQALRKDREIKRPGSGFGSGRGRSSPFLLTGLIHCASCRHTFQGYTVRKGKVKKDGERVKTFYYCCGGAITKGKSVCRRVPFSRDVLDGFVIREIGVRVTRFLDEGGRAILRDHVRRLLASGPTDPGFEIASLRARLKEIDARADELVEMMSPANQDFVERKLAKLRGERHAAEARLETLSTMNYQPPDIEGTVEAVLDELRDFRRVIAEGTMEEKKAFVRAFIPGITLDPRDRSAVIRIRRFPLPAEADNGNRAVRGVAGAGFEPATFGL